MPAASKQVKKTAQPALVIETKPPQEDVPPGPAPPPPPAAVDLYGPHGLPLVDVDGVTVHLGREDDEAVWKAFSGKKDALMQCHLDELAKDPQARDFDVSLVLVIASSGKVREAEAVSSPRNPGFEVCILGAVMKMGFSFVKGFVDDDGNPVETAVEYDIPITFTPAD